MRNGKRFLATLTVATMVLSPMTAFAATPTTPTTPTAPTTPTTPSEVTDPGQASGNIGGNGQLEGYVNKDVFRIVVPTVSDVDFTADPQGLLNIAASAEYTGGAGAVYFANAGAGGTVTYSDKSDPITVINKSSYDVDVNLDVTVTAGDVELVADKADLATATVPSLYMGVITDNGTAATIDEASFKTDAKKVNGVPEVSGSVTKGYTIKASTTDPGDGTVVSPSGQYYSFGLTDDFQDSDAAKVSYQLTAACDKTADWSKVDDNIDVSVVWSCKKHANGPTTLYSLYYEGEGGYLSKTDFTEDNGANAPEGQRGFESVAKSDVTNFKVNDTACDFSITDDGYLLVTDAQVAAAIGDANVKWVVTFTCGGVDYTAEF